MAFQSVFSPSNSSLLITDRSWLRPENAQKPGQSKFRLGESSVMNGLTVNVVKTSIKPSTRQVKEPRKGADLPRDRGLQFVNTTQNKQGKKDAAEQRRLIRSHVMTGTRRETKRSAKAIRQDIGLPARLKKLIRSSSEDEASNDTLSHHSSESWQSSTSPELRLVPSDMSTPLYGATSFKIKPQFYRFISYYSLETASDMYPLQEFLTYNPVKLFWFPLALTDEVLLHTIMYSAAFGLAQAELQRGANDMMHLAGRILELLGDRLSGDSPVNDATISAVSCLVMVENMANNQERRKVHLKGLKRMIELRGGLRNIDPSLVMKIMRSDVEGSIDTLAQPILLPLKRQTPTLYHTLPLHARKQPSKTFSYLLDNPGLREELKSILLTLSNFTTAMQYYTSTRGYPVRAINPRSFDEDLLSIARHLLAITHRSAVEETVQIAALLFTRSIARGLPANVSPPQSQLLPKRLRQALSMSLNTGAMNFPTDVLLWVLVTGALASARTQPQHTWFVDELAKLNVGGGIDALRDILFVDVVHAQACAKLFEEVAVLRRLRRVWPEHGAGEVT